MNESTVLEFNPRRSARNAVATSFNEIEFTESTTRKRRSKKKAPSVKYVGPLKKAKSFKLPKIKWSLQNIGWIICGALILRLLIMDGGVFDFYSMEEVIENKTTRLDELRDENVQIIKEIKKIKTSGKYQKKLARKHLGHIAQDEYLIIFAKN